MADQKASALTSIPAIDRAADFLYIVDTSGATSNKVTPNFMLGISGNPVGHTDLQTLSNKTLGNTNTITQFDNSFALQDPGNPTSFAQFDTALITVGQTRTYALPDANTTLVGTGVTQTLTNKTLTSPTINTATIVNPTITADSIAGFSASTTGTIYGLAITTGTISSAGIANNAVITAGINDSAVTPAKLFTGTGSSWAWQSWVPTWTNVTVGNGVTTAFYNQTGKTVHCTIGFTMGTTSAMGTNPIFTLPVTANARYGTATTTPDVGIVYIEDAGVAGYHGVFRVATTTTANVSALNAASTYIQTGLITSAAPFTWGTGDYFIGNFFYEAA